MEDNQLDELLRNVSVPQNLRTSLLTIPDRADAVAAPTRSSGTMRIAVSVVASIATAIAATILFFLFAPPADMAVNENSDTETAELLLAEMRQNLESMEILQQIHELEQAPKRFERAEPILSIDESVALAMSIPWQASIDRGASIETVRTELEYVIQNFPGTLGARKAESILQIN